MSTFQYHDPSHYTGALNQIAREEERRAMTEAQVPSNRPEATGRISEVNEQVFAQEKIVQELAGCVKEIEARLHLILRVEPDTRNPTDSPPVDPLVPLAGKLRDHNQMFVSVLLRLSSILSRLEL
jgi:hypothetical protein